MDTIILERNAAQRLNPVLFQEEVEAALGRPVLLEARQRQGRLVQAVVYAADGSSFSEAEEQAVLQLAALHQPDQPSSVELEQEAKSAQRAAAIEDIQNSRLAQIDDLLLADDVRQAAVELTQAVKALAVLVQEYGA